MKTVVKKPNWKLPAAIVAVILTAAMVAGFSYPPRPAGNVNDYSGVLKPHEKKSMEARLAKLSASSGVNVSAAIFKDLGGEPIAKIAPGLFATWKPRVKSQGVLLVIAMREKALRIEIAKNLEKRFPPQVVAQIVRDALVPPMRQGHVYSALNGFAEKIEQSFGVSPVSPALARSESHPRNAQTAPRFGGQISAREILSGKAEWMKPMAYVLGGVVVLALLLLWRRRGRHDRY